MSVARWFWLVIGLGTAIAADASTPGDFSGGDKWLVKIGVHDVIPKSNNGTLAAGALSVDVGSSVRPTASLEYLFTPSIGVELLAAWPFEHEIRLNGAYAADTKELPPTLSLHYHFNPAGSVSPFVGVGVNYTQFFRVDERGPLSGTDLTLGKSWGFAAQLGVDLRLGRRWLAGMDLRWMNIDTRARVDGADVGTVNIDPLAAGLYAGYRF